MESFRARPFLLNQLMRPVKTGRIVHAQIFAGPVGTGRFTAAKYVAQALNCTGAQKPCGSCPECRRILSGSAPELMIVEPDGSSIKISRIRGVIEALSLRPEGHYKCVILKNADRMTESAQNALLKTLEEAPEYAVFFLITARLSALLPTIRSRCMTLRFAPVSREETEQALLEKGISPMQAASAAELSGGCIGKALEIVQVPAYRTVYDGLVKALTPMKIRRDVALCGPVLAFGKENARLLLEILEQAARERMRGEENSPLSRLLRDNGLDGARLMKAVIRCGRMLDSHVSYQYAVEMLLYAATDTRDS